MELSITTCPNSGHRQVAIIAKDFAITDPTMSECGRFQVDPETEYGVDRRIARTLAQLNRLLRGGAATSYADATDHIPLLKYIEDLEASEDSTGCDDSLTVVSRSAAKVLFRETRTLNQQPAIPAQRQYLAAGGNRCPQCQCPDISGEFVEVNDAAATQTVHCLRCNAIWDDQYRLTGYELTEEGS